MVDPSADSAAAPAPRPTLAERASEKTPPLWLIPWISRTHVALYKLTGGRIGATLAGKPGLLLRTVGRKSGEAHTVCLPFLRVGDDRVIVASYGGGPKNPAWYHNLADRSANPEVIVRDRGQVFWAVADVLTGDDHAATWALVVDDAPWYGSYQTRTTRQIPLVKLRFSRPYTA
jgi:deazaflavin-dependent oxidoreductase (nitroreductase family)